MKTIKNSLFLGLLMLLSIGSYAQKDSTKLFHGSYASSFNGQKYGFIEPTSRKVLIDYKYDKVMPFDYTYRGFASVYRGKQEYLLDTLGKEYPIASRFEDLTDETRAFFGVVTPEVCKFTKLQYVINKYSSREKNPVNIPSEIANLKDLFYLKVVAKTLQSFPDNIGELTKLKTLVVSSNIETFPVNICKITSLEKLTVEANFATVPTEIGQLTNLKRIKLKGKLTALPASFSNLKKLERINFSSNKFEAFPEVICSLSQAKTITFYSNKITKLPNAIGNLKNLKILYLGYNKLEFLPNEIGNLSSLEDLQLKNNNIKTVPKTLGKLSNLTRLNFKKCKEIDFASLCNAFEKHTRLISISDSDLSDKYDDENLHISIRTNKVIPPEIGKLTSLQTLYVFASLDEVSSEIGKCINLETLGLRHTYLKSLPEEIGNLTNLKVLDLKKAQFTTLPKGICKLKNLEKLNLEENKLTSLPAEIGNLTSLKELILTKNELTTIPQELSKLVNLESVSFYKNKLPLVEVCNAFKNYPKRFVIGRVSAENVNFQLKIDLMRQSDVENVIPKEIGDMKNLVGFSADYMEISNLPEEIGNLQFLELLDVSDTKISKLPNSLNKLTNLKYLDVQANKLTEISAQATYLQTLSYFNISGNKLTSLPASLFTSQALKTLIVANNQITELPKTITKAQQLELLNLSGNPITIMYKKMYKLKKLSLLDISKCEKIDYVSVFKAFKKSKKELSIGNYYQTDKYTSGNGLLLKMTFTDKVPSEIQYLKKNLKNLSVKGSKMKELPTEISLLTQLETLTLTRSIKKEERAKIKKIMHESCVIN